MKILLLEDEYTLRKSIKELLEESGYVVEEYSEGKAALEAIFNSKFDLLLLDVNVPGINGFELLESLRKNGIDTPTIFITSLTEIDSLEKGYDLGCCDYIKKPFDMKELKLRVASALRLASLRSNKDTIKLPGGYEYHTKCFTLTRNNEEIGLSKTEKMILDLFIKHKNQVVTPEMITEYVWDDYVDPANVRVQINNLRKKLDKDLIKNIRGVGYKLEA
ncbi:response regulator transcription factor [Nitrosophilus alvini]|uniref:response regulator transcription factor n=1 Tax=Nitrosophilus alvini TaxID=2714855 RepID=UPI00190B948E|nr:response regulator transcription factor [Nitrosophilus alvini]